MRKQQHFSWLSFIFSLRIPADCAGSSFPFWIPVPGIRQAHGRSPSGSCSGVIIGALLMGVLNLGMSIMGIDQNIQKVVKGMVLLAAVIFDVVSKRKSFIVK